MLIWRRCALSARYQRTLTTSLLSGSLQLVMAKLVSGRLNVGALTTSSQNGSTCGNPRPSCSLPAVSKPFGFRGGRPRGGGVLSLKTPGGG